MKYIKKNQPPQELTDWKKSENEDWKPTYKELRGDIKTSVHQSLLKEQGFICCYCGQTIHKEDSHIEHLKPQHQYPDLALDYNNMIASCQGEREEPPPVPVHCGHKKHQWYDDNLMVSPLDVNCADFFHYTIDGQMLPSNDPDKNKAAQTTIEKIGLNIDKLKRMRKKEIERILEEIERILGVLDALSSEDIKMLIDGFEKPDTEGKYSQFSFVLVYILKQYLPTEL